MRLGEEGTTLHPILRTHEQISGYRLIKRIGRGGVAEVWEAESPSGYRVALKLVHLSTDLRSGELRTLKITREIRHPSLLGIFGTWQVEGLLVLSMELADRSLWDRFLEANVQGLRGIPCSELLGYLGSVAEAIDYLNEYKHSIAGRKDVGIQHRDLKPQNIVLLGGRAKVADFGLARIMEQAIASHTGPCTLPYAAPEYFGGKTSRQSDQYALGVTYCQLRGGSMPFLGSTAQITFGHMYNDPDLESLPAPERPIVARALAKRPEERWPDCRSFIAALKALGSDQGCFASDLLPRDRRTIDSEQDDRGGPSVPSDFSLNSADSDFIPVDTCDLELAGSRGGYAGPGVAPLKNASFLDRPSGSAPLLRGAAIGERPDGAETSRLTAWLTDLRPKFAGIGRVAALAALGLITLTHWVRSLVARLRLSAPSSDTIAAWTAGLRPKFAGIGRLAALAALGLALWTHRVRSLLVRLRLSAPSSDTIAAWLADLRPKFAGIGRVAALAALGLITLTHWVRSLVARLRLSAPSSDTIAAWTAGLRPKFAGIGRLAALAALGLALWTHGAWTLTDLSHIGGPSSGKTVARTPPREPVTGKVGRPPGTSNRVETTTVTPVASDESQRTIADTSYVTVEHKGTAPPTTVGVDSLHGTGIAKESVLTTPDEPTLEAETTPKTPVVAAPEPKEVHIVAARPREKAPESPKVSAESKEKVPEPPIVSTQSGASATEPPVESVQPRATETESFAVAAPASTNLIPGNLTSSGPGSVVASLTNPDLIPPTLTPLPSASDRVKLDDKSTLAAPTGGIDGDPPSPTSAGPVVSRVIAPSITLPAAVSVLAGETTKLPIGVLRGDTSKPAHLDFHGLPRGITVGDPTIPAGTDAADVILTASATTPPGAAEVAVVFTAGSERGEAAIRINVLPSPATVAYERGRADLNRGAYAQAVTAFTEAIRLAPDTFEAPFHRGVAYYLDGHYQEALADYTSAIRVQPGSADAHLVRARVRRDLGQHRLALEDYTEAIRLRPDAKVYLARGSLQHEMGAYGQALADYEIALHLRPSDPAAHYRRGVTRYVMGDNAGAIQDLTEVIRHDPEHAGAYHYRGDAFARLGEYARAGADHDSFERLSHPSSKGMLKQ